MLAHVVLEMTVKEFFEIHLKKFRYRPFSHLTFTAWYDYKTYFQLLYTQLKRNVLKRWVPVQYSGVDFSRLVKNNYKD